VLSQLFTGGHCYRRCMARLDAAQRASLPASAFAYIDARGRRRLPIYDESHVRNALARFNQVVFEDEDARDRARKRLLNAAKRHGIVPVGFMDGQLRLARDGSRADAGDQLPSGFLTMVMTDIEGSTALVHRLGDRYQGLLSDLRALLRTGVKTMGGHVVEARADEFFAVFEDPIAAIDTAVGVQRKLGETSWVEDLVVRMRFGIHSGYPKLADANYIGMPVHLAARICAAAHGGQILVSDDTKLALKGSTTDRFRFKSLGRYRLRSIPDELSLFQVTAEGLDRRFPPLRT
jgi:class 3 adenylate cyclase